MKVLVIGAGAVGRATARALIAHYHDVTLVDRDPDAIRVALVPDADWVLADAASPTQLEEAGAREADALAALTGDDKANLVVSLLAKTEFGVPQVIARANHPSNEWMYNESWGVDVMASTPQALTAIVTEAISVGDSVELLSLDHTSTSIYKIEIPRFSKQVGTLAAMLPVPEPLVLGSVVRDGAVMAPPAAGALQTGDALIIICERDSEPALAALEELVE